MIARWVRDLILDTVDPWIAQAPEYTKEQLLELVILENEEGNNMFMGSKHYNVVLMARKSTHWVADVHLFAKCNKPWKIVETVKRAQDYLLSNTDFERLEMRTHIPSVCKLAERCGWTKEGEHPRAVKLENGSFITEYSYGVTNGRNS